MTGTRRRDFLREYEIRSFVCRLAWITGFESHGNRMDSNIRRAEKRAVGIAFVVHRYSDPASFAQVVFCNIGTESTRSNDRPGQVRGTAYSAFAFALTRYRIEAALNQTESHLGTVVIHEDTPPVR